MVINLPSWLPLSAIQFFLAGVVGLLANYVSLRGKGYIQEPLTSYFFSSNPGRTFATLLALVAAMFAAILVGGLATMQVTSAVAAGFGTGWALDAGVNKGGY